MPLRAPNIHMNAAVGRMIFGGGATKKTIAKSLNAVPAEKWQKALQKQGLHGMTVDKLSHALSGNDRAGISQHEMKRVVAALQETGVASEAQGAGHMVLTAARQAQELHAAPTPRSPVEVKRQMKKLAQERRKEANDEDAQKVGEENVSVLDRMRGAQGMANKRTPAQTAEETPSSKPESRSNQGPKLAPKIVIPNPKTEPPSVFFQS